MSLKVCNLPPHLRDKKVSKPLAAIIECNDKNVNKFNNIIVEEVNQNWIDKDIYDVVTGETFECSFHIISMMNDMKSTQTIMGLQKGNCKILPCMCIYIIY